MIGIFKAGSIVLHSVTLMWCVRSLSIAAYQQVTSTIMSRQRERQRHSSRRPRPNNANPSVPTGRSTTDIFFI